VAQDFYLGLASAARSRVVKCFAKKKIFRQFYGFDFYDRIIISRGGFACLGAVFAAQSGVSGIKK
jgi:hypothetical protein